MVVLHPVDTQDAVLKLAYQNLADSPPQYEQRDVNVGTSTIPPAPAPPVVVVEAPPAPPPKDVPPPNLNYTRRIKFSLRCLYASLSLCIPIYILQMTPWCAPIVSWWLFPVGNMLTITFSAVVTLVIFRDRARSKRVPTTSSSTPKLPALCKLSILIPCFLLVGYWIFTGLLVFSFRYTNMAPLEVPAVPWERSYQIYRVFPFVELVFLAGQIAVLLAIGVMGAQERTELRRRLKQKDGEA